MASRSDLSGSWREKSVNPRRSSSPGSERSNRVPGNKKQSGCINNVESAGSRQVDTPRFTRSLRGEDDPRTLQAIDERRRVYVGNMPYIAKKEDVENLFANGDYLIEHINMSIDPFTGRNPSYCFVELETEEQADLAIRLLNGKNILGRPVKLGLGVASGRKPPAARSGRPERPFRQRAQPTFDRWVRTDAEDHLRGYAEQKRRLYIGGLPQMDDHYSVDADVRNLFHGFTIDAVSKVIVPHDLGHNNRYLFVDFPTAEETERARKAVNGKLAWGVKVRVAYAKGGNSSKVDQRQNWGKAPKPAQHDSF